MTATSLNIAAPNGQGTAPVMASASTSSQRFDALDSLRGICALLVVFYHFHATGVIGQLAVVRNGWLFVDFFFVLSGFVIAHSYQQRLAMRQVSVGRFMWLRWARVYPAHLAVLTAFLLAELALAAFGPMGLTEREAFTGQRSPDTLLSNLLLLQSLGLDGRLSWNGPAWSISAEFWTYLAFALLFIATGRRATWAAGVLSLLALAALVSFHPGSIDATWNGGVLRCIFGFGLGILVYAAHMRRQARPGTAGEIAAAIITLLTVAYVSGPLTFLAPVVFAGAIWVMASESGALSRALRTPLPRFLGAISYSTYMVHIFVQARLGDVLTLAGLPVRADAEGRTLVDLPAPYGDVLTLAMALLVVLTAWLSYRWVEVPAREWSRRIAGRRIAGPRAAR